MKEDLFGRAKLSYYEKSCPVLALDEYKKDKGEDDFSRKQVWFYVYGEQDIEEEFYSNLESLINSRFVDDELDWDLMTIYPTHSVGEVNPNMRSLVESLASSTGIEYRQVINRVRKIQENHELDSTEAKAVNLKDSVEIEDFEADNIILIDNITLSGTSMLHGANKLLENGAKNVFGICLGMGESFPKRKVGREKKASELMKGDES